MNTTVKTAVLLAAGRGARLRPHTDLTPKPLLPVNGAPTLDLYFRALQAVGVGRVVLVTHYLANKIEQYAQQVPTRFQIKCTTVHQNTLDGTASALEAAASVLQSETDFGTTGKANGKAGASQTSFLLMATDYLVAAEFISDFLTFHEAHGADVSVSLKRVPTKELSSRSSVRFGLDNSILEIVEKPELGKAPSDLSANLAYVLPAAVLQYLPSVVASARGEREVQSAINAYLANGGSAQGLIQKTPSEWTPELNG